MRVSNCCGSPEREGYLEMGICTECLEHCDYEDEVQEEDLTTEDVDFLNGNCYPAHETWDD